MGWPKGIPRKGYIKGTLTPTMKQSEPREERAIKVVIDPYSGGHIPNKRMVRFCGRCAAFYAGREVVRIVYEQV